LSKVAYQRGCLNVKGASELEQTCPAWWRIGKARSSIEFSFQISITVVGTWGRVRIRFMGVPFGFGWVGLSDGKDPDSFAVDGVVRAGETVIDDAGHG